MKIFKEIRKAKAFTNQSTVTIGNFDGVHLGHRKIIARAKELASQNKVGIITFNPHPRDYFLKNSKPFKLTRTEKKYNLIKALGMDFVIELRFDRQLENCSPEQFVENILAKNLGIKNVLVGQDFRFGHERGGDFNKLKSLGISYNINAFAIELNTNGEQIISSTQIRKALERGEPEKARAMLGYWHQICGKVVRGAQRGHELGFPTANITLEGILIPRFGVYSCIVEILSGKLAGSYKGAASIGKKPTFGDNEANLEVNLFDFSNDIYGTEISISLINFQRPEEKFETIESLIKQMQLDCEQASANLSSFSLSKS